MVSAYRRLTFKLLFELTLITLHQEQEEIKESILSLIEVRNINGNFVFNLHRTGI